MFRKLMIFLLLGANLGFAETVILKSGRKIEAKIIEKTEEYVKLDYYGVPLTYYNEEIESVEKTKRKSEKNKPVKDETATYLEDKTGLKPEKPYILDSGEKEIQVEEKGGIKKNIRTIN